MRSTRILDAMEFAMKAHRGQYRKGTDVPYIVHPIHVGNILIEADCNEDIIIAGILHDVLEDTRYTRNDIANKFGARVALLVTALSEPDKSLPWEERKMHTVRELETVTEDVVVVTLADKLDNMRNMQKDYRIIGDKIWSRFKRGKEKQKWYYGEMYKVFKRRLSKKYPQLVNEFRDIMREIF